MISVESNFNMKAIHAYMERRAEEQIQGVVEFFLKKGLQYTELARIKAFDKQPYTNRTYNLVSSVGFGIARNSKIIHTHFPVVATGIEGKEKGEALAEKVAQELCGNDEVALVLVAGENYAKYVEGNGKDVIAGSSNAFEAYVNQIWGAFK